MISLILHDVRSLYNVGSILRTADGFGVKTVYLTGYTPYPRQADDKRLPHVIDRVEQRLHKTALGAEKTVKSTPADIFQLISQLKKDGHYIVGVEQDTHSVPIQSLNPNGFVTLVLGSETSGLPQEVLELCDVIAEIPMKGLKKSFNVSVAAAIALNTLQTQP